MKDQSDRPNLPPAEAPFYPPDPRENAAKYFDEAGETTEAEPAETPESADADTTTDNASENVGDELKKEPRGEPAEKEETKSGEEELPEVVVSGDETPPTERRREKKRPRRSTELEELEQTEEEQMQAYEKAMQKLTEAVKLERTRILAEIDKQDFDWDKNRQEIARLAEEKADDLAQKFNERREQFAVVKHLLREIHVPGSQTVRDKFTTIVLIGLLKLEYWSKENFLHRVQRKVGKKMMEQMADEYGQQWEELVQRLKTEAPELFEEESAAEVA